MVYQSLKMSQNLWLPATEILAHIQYYSHMGLVTCGRYLQFGYLKCSLVQASGCDGQERHQRDEGPTHPMKIGHPIKIPKVLPQIHQMRRINGSVSPTHLKVRVPKFLKDKDPIT